MKYYITNGSQIERNKDTQLISTFSGRHSCSRKRSSLCLKGLRWPYPSSFFFSSSSPLSSSSSSLNLGYINAFSLYIPLKNLNPQTPDLENQALELSRNPPMSLFRFHRLWIFSNISLKNENRWSIMFVPSIQIGKKIERSVDIT